MRQARKIPKPEVPEGQLTTEGVLPDSTWRAAIGHGWVTADESVPEKSIQPASLDLRLGSLAYRLRSSFLPGDAPVISCISDYQLGPPISLDHGAVLEQNRPYLIPLLERLNLPEGVRARSNPKSSIGRLDIFTRIVVDYSPGFDEIPAGYSGPLYLEVVSRSFTIEVARALPLNQIRIVYGDSNVPDKDLQRTHIRTPLLYQHVNGKPPRPVAEPVISDGLFLTVDLSGRGEEIVGYRAKKNSMLLNLSEVSEYAAEDFWEQVFSDKGRLILEPEEFYLLVSREGVAVPENWAGEMTAYDPTSGELRTHYAGFFDPGFGFSQSDGVYGTRAVLEVRAHDVPFSLQDGQKIARLVFEHMARAPDRLYGSEIGSSYQNQRLKLSKIFRDWSPKADRRPKTGQPLKASDQKSLPI